MKSTLLKYSVKASLVFSAVLVTVSEAFAADTQGYKGLNTEHQLDGNEVFEMDVVDGEALVGGHVGDATHAGKHASSGLPQMDPTWFPSQIFWLAVTFLCLYIIFSRKILPEISGTLEMRREQIESDLNSAQELKEEAETVHAAYESNLDEARKKSTALFNEAEENIKTKADKKLQSFREKTQNQIAATEAEIAKAKDAAMGEMHNIAAEIASVAAEKIVGVSTDMKQAKSLVKNLDKKAA